MATELTPCSHSSTSFTEDASLTFGALAIARLKSFARRLNESGGVPPSCAWDSTRGRGALTWSPTRLIMASSLETRSATSGVTFCAGPAGGTCGSGGGGGGMAVIVGLRGDISRIHGPSDLMAAWMREKGVAATGHALLASLHSSCAEGMPSSLQASQSALWNCHFPAA